MLEVMEHHLLKEVAVVAARLTEQEKEHAALVEETASLRRKLEHARAGVLEANEYAGAYGATVHFDDGSPAHVSAAASTVGAQVVRVHPFHSSNLTFQSH